MTVVHAPIKFQTGFEDIKLPEPVTSLAKMLDKDKNRPAPKPEDLVITKEEWAEVAQRQVQYRKYVEIAFKFKLMGL